MFLHPPPSLGSSSHTQSNEQHGSSHLRRLYFFAVAFLLLSMIFFGPESPLAYGAGLTVMHLTAAPGQKISPNKLDPTTQAQSKVQPYTPNPLGTEKPHAPQPIAHNVPMQMHAGSVDLQSGQDTHFLSSDGHLDITIPAGAISASDLQQADGKLTLQISQIAPSSGSNAGGSGHLSLGTYLFQLVDAKGVLVDHGLRQSISTKYHYTKSEAALNLGQAYIVQNGTLPQQGVKSAATKANIAVASTFGKPSTQPVQLNKAQNTLQATPLIGTPSTSMSFQSDASIGTFGKPDPFNVDLSGGGLTANLPIETPEGPGGLTPPVTLAYSSEGVNGQHNPTGATGWVGEGWNLSMGSINWAEHNVYAGCSTTACGGGVNWENTWELSDPFGTSSELIPPDLDVSTYFDDTTNTYCDTGSATAHPCPILWHTATETHAKIYAYVGPNTIPNHTAKPPCFRVWLPNGIMEEFGCTTDSLQTYYQASVGGHVASSWLLDMITDPKGNQVHFTYQQDNTTDSAGHTTTRDVVLNTIEYDSPSCHDAQTMCTGTNWNPLVRLNFQTSHAPGLLTSGTPTGCNTGANLRCDDPLDLSSSGGVAAPAVQSTFVLNDVLVQIRSSSASAWNTLRDYRLGYEQSGPSTITDPSSGKQESAAGMLDLTQVQEIGAAGATSIIYSGRDNSATSSFGYMKVFDLTGKNVVVGPNTSLSYWIFPQGSETSNLVSGNNSTCVAVDMIFTDGTNLRDSGAVDQNGVRVHPSQQCGHLNLNQWNLVTSNIGSVRNGKTISRINIGYDQPANTGGYRGYVDDISLTNPTSTTPLFSTTLENGDMQPTWTNTAEAVNNIVGICCALTGPELFTQTGVAHSDSAAQPLRTFSYTSQTNSYEDNQFHPNPTTNCGPSWNTGNGSGCLLWSKSYANNSRFLASSSNGMGLAQTFSWDVARSNTHGVPGGGANNADPLFCNSHQSGYPCNEADDQSWSHVVLTQGSASTVRLTQNGVGGTQTPTTVTNTTGYNYQLTYPLASQQCGDCVAGFYWGNQNDTDYLSYYNNKFMGFAQAKVTLPDGASEVHKFFATQGIGIYDTGQVTCFAPTPCHASPWWNLNNAAHGQEYESFSYDTDGTTLLQHATNTYQAVCPPVGVAPTPAHTDQGKTYTWDGNLVSELDHNNPVAVCDVQQTQSVHEIKDGGGNNVTTTTAPIYDNYGRVTQQTTTTNGGTASQSIEKTSYVWNDAVTATKTSATGTYIIEAPAFTTTEDSLGNRFSCSYTSYDGQAYTTGQTSTLTAGLATTSDSYTNCGTSASGSTPSGLIRSTSVYDSYGHDIATNDADANAGISGHQGCSISSVQYTDCTTYDSIYATLETASTNALNQTTSTTYGSGTLGGFGSWPVAVKDFNNQTTSYTYDSLGRMTSQTLPGESAGNTTQNWTFATWCAGTAAQAPCVEVDETSRFDSSTTAITRAFYDGEGRLVETRHPGGNGQDIIAYAYHDSSGHMIFESNSYYVPAYTGPAGPAAFSPPDSTQVGTSTTYDGQERPLTVKDPNSQSTQTRYAVVCGVSGTSDTGCYEQTTIVDANQHQRLTLTDGFGKADYDRRYNGNSSGTYSLYATTSYVYDLRGHLVSIKHPDGNTTTNFTFDDTGQKIAQQDPDRGTENYTYDPNGNLIQSVDARGSAGTVYAGYDGLNRLLWRNSTNSANGASLTYTYDSTANGNIGIGRKTGETFTGSGGLSGSYTYTYDVRGQHTGQTISVNGTNYTLQKSYNDAGHLISETYPTGEVVQASYVQGWLAQVSATKQGTTTTLASGIHYDGLNGAAAHITSMLLGNNVYTYNATYDTVQRLTSSSLSLTNGGMQLYKTQPSYDGTGNVTGVQTALTTGTDNQQFCYDEQNRLTWAGSTGTPACGGTLTAGTLTGAQYQQSYTYDVLGRLTGNEQGSNTYGDSNHIHAATASSGGYSASYDAAGNMICRSPSSATTCSGSSPSGQLLSYDTQGMLSTWQDQPTPTKTVNYLYDGEGTRVALQVANGGTTTTTAYIDELEEVQTSGSNTSVTTYYYAKDQRIAEAVNGVFSYLANDRLGSPVMAVNASGTVQGMQLYSPYGNTRYSSGTMPTTRGFTGQVADAVTGLDYYGSRYYDPALGQFTSADTALPSSGYDPWGLSRYAYVQGNPETLTDPDGHCWPWCTMAIGALVGAAIGAGVSIVSQAASGHGVNWHSVAKEAAVGAITGAISGLAGPGAGMAVHAAVGAVSGAVGQVVSNHLNHKPLGDGVFTAAVVGGALGFASAGAAKLVSKFGGKFLGRFVKKLSPCGESFRADTPVATPDGAKAISDVQVGDQVQAYDPATKQVSTQTVQNVFINHDNDLIDVTVAANGTTNANAAADPGSKQKDVDVKSHGSHAPPVQSEVVHTTQSHPWLTTKGWILAGQLHLGDVVQRLDGTTATVVELRVVPGAQDMYDLTVSNVHTFAVGGLQEVVHNCNLARPYRLNRINNGHHIFAKAAWRVNERDIAPYNYLQALVIKNRTMLANGWNHGAMSTAQRRLFDALYARVAAGTGQNTMREHIRIAVESLIAGNVPAPQARHLVAHALLDLRRMGISHPFRIPWH